MEKFLGQSFYVNLAETQTGLLGFNGKLLAIDGDFWTFRTLEDVTLIVNVKYIKSLRPIA
ncbi:MAG: hypothetical protein WCS90_00860 [Bacilli bacterium]